MDSAGVRPQRAGRRRRDGGNLVTYFTFLPSFIFILLGGPLVESTHGELNSRRPDRHYGGRGRRDPQSRGVLRLESAVARINGNGSVQRQFEWVTAASCGSVRGPVPLRRRRHPADCACGIAGCSTRSSSESLSGTDEADPVYLATHHDPKEGRDGEESKCHPGPEPRRFIPKRDRVPAGGNGNCPVAPVRTQERRR